MTYLTKLSTAVLTASFAFTGVALAGSAAFSAADVNTDGSLDRDEFRVFVGIKADNGDVAFSNIRDTGDYESAFKKMDADADGKLSQYELVPEKSEDKPVMDEQKWDEPELEQPEQN